MDMATVETFLRTTVAELAVKVAAAKPMKIATPPSRGIGTACTSRSRTSVKAPTLIASR